MRLSVPGRHMALNALGALLAAVEVGAPVDAVLDGLAGFEGVRRRFELVGTANGIRVFDDYAHHPTEVRAALAALRTVAEQSGGGRTLVVFQPHLYSRTKAFAAEFGTALDGADGCSCSTSTPPGNSRWPGSAAPPSPSTSRCRCNYLPDFSAVAARVAEVARPGDVIVTMGAGDVTMLGPEILTALQVPANRNAPGQRGGEPDDPDEPVEPVPGAPRRADAPSAMTACRWTDAAPCRRSDERQEGESRADGGRNSRGRAGGSAGNGPNVATAQARARAIEEARREAKRRARRPDSEPKPDARGSVRG